MSSRRVGWFSLTNHRKCPWASMTCWERSRGRDGVAGDHAPLQGHPVEQPQRRLVLVGLVLGAVGHGHLSEREARSVGHQGEQVHGLLQAVETAPGRLAVEGERLQGAGPRGLAGAGSSWPTGSTRPRRPSRPRRSGPCGSPWGAVREAESMHQRDVLVLPPLADRRVTPRAGHEGATHQGEDGREAVSPSVPAARIGDLGQKGKQTSSDGRFHATPPCNASQENRLPSRQNLLLFSELQRDRTGRFIRRRDRIDCLPVILESSAPKNEQTTFPLPSVMFYHSYGQGVASNSGRCGGPSNDRDSCRLQGLLRSFAGPAVESALLPLSSW